MYYQTLKKGSLKEINDQVAVIDASSFNSKDAFKGALLMKGWCGECAKAKLDFFKSGRIKLKQKLKTTANTEFRF